MITFSEYINEAKQWHKDNRKFMDVINDTIAKGTSLVKIIKVEQEPITLYSTGFLAVSTKGYDIPKNKSVFTPENGFVEYRTSEYNKSICNEYFKKLDIDVLDSLFAKIKSATNNRIIKGKTEAWSDGRLYELFIDDKSTHPLYLQMQLPGDIYKGYLKDFNKRIKVDEKSNSYVVYPKMIITFGGMKWKDKPIIASGIKI